MLLGFLARWWQSRRQARPSPRKIFGYSDGSGRQRWVDPVATHAAIEAACPEWGELLDSLGTDPSTVPSGPVRDGLVQQRKDARVRLLAATRHAFGVEAFTDAGGRPRGLTEGETITLLHEFLNWMLLAAGDALPFVSSPGLGVPSPATSPTAPSAASSSAAT